MPSTSASKMTVANASRLQTPSIDSHNAEQTEMGPPDSGDVTRSTVPPTVECLVSLSCRGASRHIRRHWTQQLSDRPFHGAVHFRNHRWDIALIDVSYLRNSVGPNGRPRSKICHLRGDCDFDLDATLVVDFLELLQSSAKHVVDVGATVVGLDAGKVSAGAKALDY